MTKKQMMMDIEVASAERLRTMITEMKSGKAYTSVELQALIGDDFLSTESIEMYFRANFMSDRHTYFQNGEHPVYVNGVLGRGPARVKVKRYINVEDPEDIIEVESRTATFKIDKYSK